MNLVPTGEMNIEQRLLNNKLSFKTAAAAKLVRKRNVKNTKWDADLEIY